MHIVECLEDHVYDKIMELNTCVLDTLLEEEIVCFLCGTQHHEAS